VRTLRAEQHTQMLDEMADFAEAMQVELQQRRGLPAPVCYGQPALGGGDVRESYRQARVALGIARRLHRTEAVSYQELRSFMVLAQAVDTEPSRQLVREVLAPLRSTGDLLDTLITYLAHGANVNATARALKVHRNTMLAKLDRISRGLGMDIRLPETQFTVSLAIRLDMLDEVNSAVEREASFR
jgi:DNA-binding PucR family transcriptional regulator